MITIEDVKEHIKVCKQMNTRYDWLRFVEDKDLTHEVEALFSVGNNWWDWVKGNAKLWELQDSIK